MLLRPQQSLTLWDAQGHCLGRVVIDRIEGDLVFGRFSPEPAYDGVQSLFADYVEAANEQLLSVVGELDEAIAALRLHLRAADGSGLPDIQDVQIGEGVITFRLRRPASDGQPPDGLAPRVSEEAPTTAPKVAS